MKDKILIVLWMLLAVLNVASIWANGLFFDICNYVFAGVNSLIVLGMFPLLKEYKEE